MYFSDADPFLFRKRLQLKVKGTVVSHNNRKGEIDNFVPYEGLNWF
jgi:hypothetical protein